MIRIIDRSNADANADVLRQQFANRYKVFVEELGWSDFGVEPGVEKDAYDDGHAVYAVALTDDGEAVGGVRFYPTTRPHMLSETFQHMIDGPVIARPDVFEATRFHLLPAYRRTEHYLDLFIAIAEVGLVLGATGMTSILRTLRLPIILETGIGVTPLGEPHLLDGISNLAVIYEVNERVLARMRKRRGSWRSVLEGGDNVALRA